MPDEWIDVADMYNGILLSHKKNDIMPFVATWIDQEIIILKEVSQTKTNIIYYCLYAESEKKKEHTNELIYKIETDTENKPMVTKGERREEIN